MTFTPNFITKVVTTLAILPIIAAPVEAKAVENLGCATHANLEWCVERVGNDTYHIEVTDTNNFTSTVVAKCAKTGTRFAIAPETHPEAGRVIAEGFCNQVTGLNNASTLAD